jgi:copper oxidase (laccase) domain-containing protein
MPKILKTLKFKQPGIATLPIFEGMLNNGFSWGKDMGNMSFSVGNQQGVLQRIQKFLSAQDMGDISDSINMYAQHGDIIVDIDEAVLEKLPPSREGRDIKCDAFFTKLPNLTLTLKPADCTSAILYCELSTDGRRCANDVVMGIVHTGRRGTSLELPKKVIGHLESKYQCDSEKIKIGIVPSLSKENRRFEHIRGIENKKVWEGFIEKKNSGYYPDETKCVLHQYIDAGVKDENIQVYDVDTFEAAANKESYSYKYRYEMKKKGVEIEDGRFIVAARI